MKRVSILLLAIFLFALAIRVLYLPSNALTFGYDQARDALQAQNILAGDFKILGPPASTPGLHHGVFWFYFLTIPNLLSGGNPIVSAYWNAFFNALGIFIVYKLGASMGNRISGLLAAFLVAVSFESTQYATWLSNPTTGAWSVPLAYLGAWLWARSGKVKKYAPLITGLGLGLSVQANVFLLFHLVPIGLWLWLARKRVHPANLFTAFFVFILAVSTMLISEFKFGFKSISGVVNLLSSQDAIIASKQLGDFVILFLNQLGRVFAMNTYPGNVGYGGMFVIILAVWAYTDWRKAKSISWQPFLLMWLFAHITVVSVGGASTPFLLVGIGPAVSLLVALFLARQWTQGKKTFASFIFIVIVLGNLSMIMKENPKGQTLFAIQKDMTLAKQLKAVDWTYSRAAGEEFSINSLTSPLWTNIVWAYIYNWYGGPTYGYYPHFHGKSQVGQLVALNESPAFDKRFLILEPLGGIPLRYLDEILAEENATSTLVNEENWGELVVQQRTTIN